MKTQNVKSFMWTDAKFKRFTKDAKLLWMYFLTAERPNMAGIFESSIDLISEETGLTNQEIMSVFQTIDKLAWHHDDYVILKNRWQYNTLSNSKVVIGITNTIIDLPDSVKKFILELDNELTWAIDTIFNVDLGISKKDRYYQSHTKKDRQSHDEKDNSSHLNLNLNLNSNLNNHSNPHVGSDDGWTDSFRLIFEDIEEDYGLSIANKNKLRSVADTEQGRGMIKDLYYAINKDSKILKKGGYLMKSIIANSIKKG